jgi:hypothetical protein
MAKTKTKAKNINPYPTCRHLWADGRLCGSPSLRGELFCYYHQRDRARARALRAHAARAAQSPDNSFAAVLASLHLPTPDDPIAIQVCISGVLQAMMTGAIVASLGGRILYGLNLAMINYHQVSAFRRDHNLEREIPPEMHPIAASDPEPIPDVLPETENEADGCPTLSEAKGGFAVQSPDEVRKAYENLETDELYIPDADEIMRETECAADEDLERLMDAIRSKPESSKEFDRSWLRCGHRGTRIQYRRNIIREAIYELEALQKAQAEATKKAGASVTL